MPTETRTIEQIEADMAEVDRLRAPLLARMDALVRERAQLRSLQWIEANGCRREDVQFSTGEGRRRLKTIWQLIDRLRAIDCQKRFCEWGGRLYITADVMAGRLDRHPPGRVEDLPD